MTLPAWRNADEPITWTNRRRVGTVAVLALAAASHALPDTRRGAAAPAPSPRVPVLQCTDLFHPHDDPDDHFDLASLYALDEPEVLGIVLDQGERQERAPGRIPVSRMNAPAGRRSGGRTTTGRSNPLRSASGASSSTPSKRRRRPIP